MTERTFGKNRPDGPETEVVTPLLALSTSNWIFLAGVIVNGLAFAAVVVSLWMLRAQGATQRDATLAVAYQNMSAQMADVARFFVDHVELRPYFYDGRALPASDPERDRVLAVAELYVNLMDDVVTQAPVLKRAGIAADWEAYFRAVYDTSPALREFWLAHGSDWFAHSPLTSLFNTRT
jgi:hypothetical protein